MSDVAQAISKRPLALNLALAVLGLADPTNDPLVKLRLTGIRRRMGTAQKQARPLRFKGPVRDVERDAPRGLNVRTLLESDRAHSAAVGLLTPRLWMVTV